MPLDEYRRRAARHAIEAHALPGGEGEAKVGRRPPPEAEDSRRGNNGLADARRRAAALALAKEDLPEDYEDLTEEQRRGLPEAPMEAGEITLPSGKKQEFGVEQARYEDLPEVQGKEMEQRAKLQNTLDDRWKENLYNNLGAVSVLAGGMGGLAAGATGIGVGILPDSAVVDDIADDITKDITKVAGEFKHIPVLNKEPDTIIPTDRKAQAAAAGKASGSKRSALSKLTKGGTLRKYLQDGGYEWTGPSKLNSAERAFEMEPSRLAKGTYKHWLKQGVQKMKDYRKFADLAQKLQGDKVVKGAAEVGMKEAGMSKGAAPGGMGAAMLAAMYAPALGLSELKRTDDPVEQMRFLAYMNEEPLRPSHLSETTQLLGMLQGDPEFREKMYEDGIISYELYASTGAAEHEPY